MAYLTIVKQVIIKSSLFSQNHINKMLQNIIIHPKYMNLIISIVINIDF